MSRQLRIGIAAVLGWTQQNTTFNVLTLGSDCGQFQSGMRTQPGFELFLENQLASHPSLWFLARAGFSSASLDLVSSQTSQEARQNGETYNVVRHYLYSTPAVGVTIGAGAGLELIPGLRFQASPTVTFFSTGAQKVTQEIISPLGTEFTENGQVTRPVTDNATTVDFRQILFGADIAVEERLPIGKRLALHPEIRASLAFGSIARNLNWTEAGFQILMGLSYDFASHREPPPVIADNPIPELKPQDVKPVEVPPVPKLTASIKAFGEDRHGNLYENPVIEIEEAPWVESVPIIPSIFFDSSSAVIAPRYIQLRSPQSAVRFRVDSLLGITPLEIHWQLMNVIGERMRANPAKRITITGTVSAGEVDAEHAEALGTARAKAVARYLADIWNIAPERISVQFDAHPSTASPEETAEGREENRRAEIRFNDEEIAKPVIIHRLATIASPPAVHFVPEVDSEATVTDWYVTVVQGDKELLRFDGNTDETRQEKQWSLGDLRVTHDLTPIRYRLVVHDSAGQEATAEGEFRVVELTKRHDGAEPNHTEVAEYSIVGFNYSSAELLPRHVSQLQDIASAIDDDADVTISGYTDRVGDAERNRQLSLDRAKAVQSALRAIRVHAGHSASQPMTVHGLGNEQEVFNNNLPEGRLLSRMVQITIMKRSVR